MVFFQVVILLAGLAYLIASIIKKDKDAAYGIGFRGIGSTIKGVIIFAISIIIMTCIGAVPTGHRGIVLQWGAATNRVLGQGAFIVLPIAQRVEKVNVQVQAYPTLAEAASADLQDVKTTITLNYYVEPAGAAQLYRDVGLDYQQVIITPAVQEAVKAATAQYNAEELIRERPKVKEAISQSLTVRLATHRIIVDAVSITDFKFSPDFTAAVENKVTAEQNALTSKNVLEQRKYEADQKVVTATADAKAIEIQAKAITQQGGRDYVALQMVKQWDGKLPTTMFGNNGSIPFLDMLKAIGK